MEQVREHRVFISHASEDRWVARQLGGRLGECPGVGAWLDVEHGTTGFILPTIRDAMLACSEVVVLFSRGALADNNWLLMEVGMAIMAELHVTVLLYGVQVEQLPDGLRAMRRLDINNADDYVAQVHKAARGAT